VWMRIGAGIAGQPYCSRVVSVIANFIVDFKDSECDTHRQ
jgi:hypothetical protein